MTVEDAKHSDSLIQGQYYVKTRLLTILYDSSASHSFISITVARWTFIYDIICLPLCGLDVILGLDCSVRFTHRGSECESYVLLVASSNDNEQSLERIRVVKEFPDIFLEDILELPPQEEIEFSIDLEQEPD
ncbi:uncharacterized protein LOC107640876 [Arachis ipaensis]|uniref:uncharacterized protein LOC107640876 n=1 Tax=Arachis ipaensis TaxID=130454 RepID=UPI0007AF222A|nr:uncharacterized protein LOC107640876 [Arachis ipaensis]